MAFLIICSLGGDTPLV